LSPCWRDSGARVDVTYQREEDVLGRRVMFERGVAPEAGIDRADHLVDVLHPEQTIVLAGVVPRTIDIPCQRAVPKISFTKVDFPCRNAGPR